MPGKAAKITITERQHDILQTLRNAVTAPAHLRQRAAIILLAFDGLRNEDIAVTDRYADGEKFIGWEELQTLLRSDEEATGLDEAA